jgi:hypothetical protein
MICRGHLERLGSILRDIEDQAALLNTVPSMAVRSGRSGSLASHRSPAVLDAIVATDPRRGQLHWGSDDFDSTGLDDTASVQETLHSWARMVREERALAQPETVTISGERDLLTRHLDWISAQPWVDELYQAMTSLLAQLKATNNTKDAPPAGRCYLPDEDGKECGGSIWRRTQEHLAWRPLPDRCERVSVKVDDGPAYCDRCGNTWDGAALHRLNVILEQQRAEASRPHTEDGRRMLTAEELVSQGIVSTVSNVRVIAHRRKIVSVDGHYDPELFPKNSRVALRA